MPQLRFIGEPEDHKRYGSVAELLAAVEAHPFRAEEGIVGDSHHLRLQLARHMRVECNCAGNYPPALVVQKLAHVEAFVDTDTGDISVPKNSAAALGLVQEAKRLGRILMMQSILSDRLMESLVERGFRVSGADPGSVYLCPLCMNK